MVGKCTVEAFGRHETPTDKLFLIQSEPHFPFPDFKKKKSQMFVASNPAPSKPRDLAVSSYWPRPRWSISPADELSAGCAGLSAPGRKLERRWPTCWTDVWSPGRTSKRLPSLSYPSETTGSPGNGTGPGGQTAPEMWQHVHWLHLCGWYCTFLFVFAAVGADLTVSTI